jgi:hypothetical protein
VNGGTTGRPNREWLAHQTEECRDRAAGLHHLLELALLLCEAAGHATRAWHGGDNTLTKTRTLQVKVDLLLFLLLLNLEFLIHLIEFFEGDATRATSRTSCAAQAAS